jgi:hypothetical protein
MANQEHGVITAPRPGVLIGRGEQRLDFYSAQEADLNARESLIGDGQHALDLGCMGRCLKGGIAKEGADGGESQVASARGNAAAILQVIQECGNQRGVDLLEG